MSLSKTQQRVLDYLEVDPVISLEDTQTHGFRSNTLDALVRKGLLTVKGDVYTRAVIPDGICSHAHGGRPCQLGLHTAGDHYSEDDGGSVTWSGIHSDPVD